MTTIDVDTSPLQAAREWRGTSLVATARSCGLPVTQAEALEAGDPGAFESIDEMIAAAVLYGASLGIGRDEATALLDRTVSRAGGLEVRLPDPGNGFSDAVQQRSARIATRDQGFDSSVLVPLEPVLPDAAEFAQQSAHPGPTPEQATAAAAEIALDTSSFSPDHGWDRPLPALERDQWVDTPGGSSSDERSGELRLGSEPRPSRVPGVVARIGGLTFSGLERVVGSEKADRAAEGVEQTLTRGIEAVRVGRERLRRSEHATLIVAMTGGAVLVALLVAIASSFGGEDDPKVTAKTASKPAATAADTPAQTPKKAAAPAPMLPPGKLTVNVFNAGSKKGAAKDVAAELKSLGYRIGEVENAHADYGGSMIIYPKNRAREAARVSKATGITTMDVAPGSSPAITVITV